MDRQMIDMLWQRNEIGIKRIETCYGKLFRGMAGRILGSREEAEECVNDVLLDIWNTIPPARPDSLSAYGCMITRRRAIDRLRYLTAEKRGGGVYDAALEELEECVPAPETSAEENEELREVLNQFVGSLSERDRRLFVGRYFAMEEMDRLAANQGMSRNAANVALSRIRKRLRVFLEKTPYGIS